MPFLTRRLETSRISYREVLDLRKYLSLNFLITYRISYEWAGTVQENG